ncbi:hypothetical protein TeGR_g6444, partial [Tetraparma gracilis]
MLLRTLLCCRYLFSATSASRRSAHVDVHGPVTLRSFYPSTFGLPESRAVISAAVMSSPAGVPDRLYCSVATYELLPTSPSLPRGGCLLAFAPISSLPASAQSLALAEIRRDPAALKATLCEASGSYLISPLCPDVTAVSLLRAGGPEPRAARAGARAASADLLTARALFCRPAARVDREVPEGFGEPPPLAELGGGALRGAEGGKALEEGAGGAEFAPLPSPARGVELSYSLGGGGGAGAGRSS